MPQFTVEPPAFPSQFHSLEDIENCLYRLQLYSSQLKVIRNAFSSTARLPVDVIVEIFLQLANLHHRPSGRQSAMVEDHLYPYRWLYITQVCKAWRTVALGTPLLWTHIVWYGTPARVETFLRRSGDCLLTIVASQHGDYQSASRYGSSGTMNAAFVAEYAHRLREVHDIGPEIYNPRSPAITHTPSSVILPALRSLHVTYPDTLESFTSTFRVPRLARLALNKTTSLSSFRMLLGPALTTLHVWLSDDMSLLTQWLDVLKETPALEEMSLGGCLGLPVNHYMDPVTPSHRVSLPNLRQLDLAPSTTGSLKFCAAILVHIASRPDVRLRLRLAQPLTLSRDILQFVMACVSVFWTCEDTQNLHSNTTGPGTGLRSQRTLRSCEMATSPVFQGEPWWTGYVFEYGTPIYTYDFHHHDPVTSNMIAPHDAASPPLSLCFALPHQDPDPIRQRGFFSFPDTPLFSHLTHITLSELSVSQAAWYAIAATCQAVTHLRTSFPNLEEIGKLIVVLASGDRHSAAALYFPVLVILHISAHALGHTKLPRPDTRDSPEEDGQPIPRRLSNALWIRKRKGRGPTVLQINGKEQSIPVGPTVGSGRGP